ncbi:TPA: hypothetical protein HA239_00440 [Candidatus Woesearchaeota archaeon]|nr:hypothetical protein QT06_C0001G1181 [archaeon GW2011_AR15]MBS3104349.1 hypothetical protein [Candidatus Woesearchaeota archaeon]HIH40867.1 hypothetical protein [Candidatus Woesearchaeota archaeon]
MIKRLSTVTLSQQIPQRGTGKKISRDEAIVYDFMPAVLGNKFRTNEILSRMLLRRAPETAPFMLLTDAYEELGLRYAGEGSIIPALECYRIALQSRTSFARAMGLIQGKALHDENEIDHMTLSDSLEQRLVGLVAESEKEVDYVAYNSWIEELREAQKNWWRLNRTQHGSEKYIEACLKIGEYQEALASAEVLKDSNLIRKVKKAQPPEILDLDFLKKYINDNYPDSTIGRDSVGVM